ncbi:MAG: dehydrogenase [Planctomycetia bacterium]|nr:dehydrogenase [Planctomycetia bacterium]
MRLSGWTIGAAVWLVWSAGPLPALAAPVWQSPVITPATPGRTAAFDVDLAGATRVWLVVDDGGDGFGCDWADWIDPVFKGPDGDTALVDLQWKRAAADWGQVQDNRNAEGGPLRVAGQPVPRGIGTHAHSVIEFDVPPGAVRLAGRAGLDDGGANQGGGSVVFSIHTQAPAAARRAGGPVDAADGPGTLALPDGLTATLFAGEPLLSSPSDIDVDAAGRVWVCEVTNYRGRKDTRPEGDRILVLEDTDGDGAADKQTVFHQGRDVDSALGICVIGDGPGRRAIVSCAPEVFILHDDDGDLVADRKEILFTKTGQPQHDHSVHAFVVGPDGRWYFNFGNTGHAVHDRDGHPVVDSEGRTVNDSGKPFRQGMVFRCRPDGSEFEVLGHNFRNNYEVAVDSFGTLWQSDNDDDGNRGVRINWVMERGNFGYVDELTGAGWQQPRANLEDTIERRHWHQNDPGVVPNLLQTGAGSPTGICVYEGSLLPERFHGALVHCDAGPNVVRAYHVRPAGAGYEATAEVLVDGAADRWFRPSDVCVAPDGSLIVADWYDPGVGGHGMGDTEKGRLYRIAPAGSRWQVPAVDLTTVAGAVAALASPNLSTRATALERLFREPAAAGPALSAALEKASDLRHAARLAWALGMMPGRDPMWATGFLAAAKAPQLRAVAIRLSRATRGDTLALAETLAGDPAPEVRREVALALAGHGDDRADRVWARLARAHVAGDRFALEALGIGADGHWDGRLAAWQPDARREPLSPAAREIVWRSRGARSAELIAALIADPVIGTSEALALVRALDFQPAGAVRAALPGILAATAAWPVDKQSVILPLLAVRLEKADAVGPLAGIVASVAELAAGTPAGVEIVARFGLRERAGDLVALAAAAGTDDKLAAAAAGAALDLGAADSVARMVGDDEAAAGRLLGAVGAGGSGKGIELLARFLVGADVPPAGRAAAVRGLARSQAGCRKLVELARAQVITGPTAQAAALAISACPWGEIRKEAAAVLPLPPARGGEPLPPVAELVKRDGNAAKGQALFAGAGTCAKCHVVAGAGKAVGPDLSGIGAKLSREALWESLLAPSAAISHNYETWTLVGGDGRSVSGLLVSRTPTAVVIRGADGIDVTTAGADVAELVKQPVSLMPADLATTLSADELVDIVAWLETLKASR